MPQCVAFDLYDERWRDCWLAATSAARLRKKQVDVDIQQRVAKLLEEYGPQSERPLTLRIYGTMVKGFCVINNERARSLCCDCERVVFTFARKPFAEGDNTIRLPAAKRPRMEAALTLDLDLARVEASEAFDWTQAPLEEGALLRLSGAQDQQEFMPPSLDFTGLGFAAEAAGLGVPTEAGWLPRLPGEAAFVEVAPEAAAQDPLLLSQLVPSGPPEVLGADIMQPPQDVEVPGAVPGFAAAGVEINQEALARQQHRRQKESWVKPGIVYGFDDEMMLQAEDYEYWQQSHSEISGGCIGASGYAAAMSAIELSERSGPRLRAILDPSDGSLCWQVPSMDAMDGHLPEVQGLLNAQAGQMGDHYLAPEGVHGMNFGGEYPAASHVGAALAEPGMWDAEMQQLGACGQTFGDDDAGKVGGAEVQDERTAKVANILRSCLRDKKSVPSLRRGQSGIAFADLVPPGVADVQTAVCTFQALLALASVGEFLVHQEEAYGDILISEGTRG